MTGMKMEEIAFNNACAVVCAEMKVYRDQLLFLEGGRGERCRGLVMYLMSDVHDLSFDVIGDVFAISANAVGFYVKNAMDLDFPECMGKEISRMRQQLNYLAHGSAK